METNVPLGRRKGYPAQVFASKQFSSLRVEFLPPITRCQMLLCLKPQAAVDPYGTINKIKPGTVITVIETPMLKGSVLRNWLESICRTFAMLFFKTLINLPVKERAIVT